VIDDFTLEHLAAWLESVHRADRKQVKEAILSLLAREPGLIETRSWPEIRRIAEA